MTHPQPTPELAHARERMMDAQDEYIGEMREIHGATKATTDEALKRIAELWKACQTTVALCRDNGADPADDRASSMVDIMMDATLDERTMVGWMCEVAMLEGEG